MSASSGRRRASPSPGRRIPATPASPATIPEGDAIPITAPITAPITTPSPYKKGAIPKALREQVWILKMGRVFEGKCKTTWCRNTITAYDFHCGHNRPESKGGETALPNLVPICSRCNLSMNDTYTFDEWCRNFQGTVEVAPAPFCGAVRFFCCFTRNGIPHS